MDFMQFLRLIGRCLPILYICPNFFMKHFTSLLLTFFFINVANSQATAEQKKLRTDMFMVHYNYESLINFPANIRYSALSRGVNIQLMYDHFMGKSKNLSVAIGLGFHSHNFFTKGNLMALPDSAGGTYSNFYVNPTAGFVKKQKYTANYFDIPFEFRFKTLPNEKGHSWKIAVGAKYGYKLNFYSKTIDNKQDKYKTYVFPDIARNRFGFSARVGYGKVGLNAFYSVTSLFNQNNGPNLQPLSLGLTITLF